ncbi:MAG: Ger(x)C family spore germination protein [Acetivibrionales bacterium]|jgi:Ger(x)C family germination protein
MKNAILLIICSFSLLLITGCWDKVDIETRGYVLGVAIDTYPPTPEGGERGKQEGEVEEEAGLIQMQLHTGKPAYAMTIQLPIIKKAEIIAGKPGGGGGGGGGGEFSRSWEVTQVGNSMIEMNREMASRLNVTPYYRHLQLIVISEDVARKGLNNVLAFFDRDHEMRKRTKLFICPGEAKKVLDVNPRIEDFSSIYLSKISMNAKFNSRIPHEIDLGEALMRMHLGMDFILPKAVATKDEIKKSAAAVFKGDKMVGWIDDLEMESVKLIRNNYLGGVVTAEDPYSDNRITALEVSRAKTKITSEIQDGLPHFMVRIDIDGNLTESLETQQHETNEKEFLEKLERAFEQSIKKQCENSIKRIQKDYKADIFGFNEYLRAKKPEYWDKAKENWDEIFPDTETEINVNVKIRQTSNIR